MKSKIHVEIYPIELFLNFKKIILKMQIIIYIFVYINSWCPPCKDLELKKQEVLPATKKRKG